MNTAVGDADTIVATATAPGIGALAIVRISGEGAHALLTRLSGSPLPPPRTAALRTLRSIGGDPLDEAIVIRYDAPRSYTGECAAEIICHGGWATSVRIVSALVEAGARPATAGEFTRRAVFNGRMDLLQAEAVNDLIRAESSAAAALALGQLDGGLSRRIVQLRDELLALEAMVAYEIDFPEEDDGPVDAATIRGASTRVAAAIEALIATSPAGELVRAGAVVAIVGRPNVGKSSLFNALLGRKRALVTETPGTTRDALEAVLDVRPIPLRLVDTAGLREATDEVERLGIAVSREYMQSASVVLACGDSVESLAAAVALADEGARGRVLAVRTKSDLAANGAPTGDGDALAVSAVTGHGLDDLVRRVSSLIAHEVQLPEPESPVLAHARHRAVLMSAAAEVRAFRAAREEGSLPATVNAVHLRAAVRVLEELIGSVDIEEILGKLFGSFCVGK